MITIMTTLAETTARHLHKGQTDKAGLPYIEHPLRVARMVSIAGGDETSVSAAWLHDVLEDTSITTLDLFGLGLSWDVVATVQLLSRNALEGDTPEAYYARIKDNPRALLVKTWDIADNLSESRLAVLPPETQQRLRAKYARALLELGVTSKHRRVVR